MTLIIPLCHFLARIRIDESSRFFFTYSCHNPASEHGLQGVHRIPNGLDIPHLLALCGLQCLLYHI